MEIDYLIIGGEKYEIARTTNNDDGCVKCSLLDGDCISPCPCKRNEYLAKCRPDPDPNYPFEKDYSLWGK